MADDFLEVLGSECAGLQSRLAAAYMYSNTATCQSPRASNRSSLLPPLRASTKHAETQDAQVDAGDDNKGAEQDPVAPQGPPPELGVEESETHARQPRERSQSPASREVRDSKRRQSLQVQRPRSPRGSQRPSSAHGSPRPSSDPRCSLLSGVSTVVPAREFKSEISETIDFRNEGLLGVSSRATCSIQFDTGAAAARADYAEEGRGGAFEIDPSWINAGSRQGCRRSSVSIKKHNTQLSSQLRDAQVGLSLLNKGFDENEQPQEKDNTTESRRDKFKRFMSMNVITPYKPPHVTWILTSICFLGYDTAVIPLDAFGEHETTFTEIMSWIARVFWTMDILVSFFTGYIDTRGEVVLTPSLVAKRYLRTQFPLDFLIVLTSWLSLIGQARATGLVRNFKLFRFARLLRLKKGRQFFMLLSEYIRAEKLHVITSTSRVFLIFLILMHFVACGWYGVSNLARVSGYPSWVELGHDDMHAGESSLGLRYAYAFHFAIALFFGEHVSWPHNILERIFVILVLYCSFVGHIMLVSSITTAMTHLEIVSARRSAMVFNLQRFLTCHKVSRELELKVLRNAKHAMEEVEKRTEEGTVELLRLISEPLLMDLHRDMYRPTLEIHPFFACLGLLNTACIRTLCHRAVAVHPCHKDDRIFSAEEKPSFGGSSLGALLFVSKGELTYDISSSEYTSARARGSRKARSVKEGSWISEAVLWTAEWIHCGTLVTTSDCQLVAVEAAHFRDVMGGWPMLQINDYAKHFVDCINEDATLGFLTDIGEFAPSLNDRLNMVFGIEWAAVRIEYATKFTFCTLRAVGEVSAVSSANWNVFNGGSRRLSSSLGLNSIGLRSNISRVSRISGSDSANLAPNLRNSTGNLRNSTGNHRNSTGSEKGGTSRASASVVPAPK